MTITRRGCGMIWMQPSMSAGVLDNAGALLRPSHSTCTESEALVPWSDTNGAQLGTATDIGVPADMMVYVSEVDGGPPVADLISVAGLPAIVPEI